LTNTDPDDRLLMTGRVRTALEGLMEVGRYQWNERGALLIHGRLLLPSEQAYPQIRARLEPFGFTPFLTRTGDEDELLAAPLVVPRTQSRRWLPALLFSLTVLTTLMAGAMYQNVDIFQNPAGILAGAPFAFTLLGILGTHEMGHYIVGRWRGAPVSLPYFIPLPPPLSFTGTMGAVIVQREPMEDRRTILEIGLAGPLAGLAVAIPLLIYGLSTSTVGPSPTGGYMQEGNSLVYAGLKWLVFGQILPSGGLDVQLNDIAWGAWIGLLVTMLNLLPVGQLDGGHAAYALLGRKADYLAYAVIAMCIALGVGVSETWLFWGILAFLIGPRHPAPLNDIARLGKWHIALAIFGLILFVLLFMPIPLKQMGV
jgi:membrane-associated protease RseP (regulator of RpoE activity)